MKKNSRNSQGFQKISAGSSPADKTQVGESKKRGSELESLLHSEHTVEIEKLVVGGNGLARIEFQHKNVVVFVPRSAPNDKVKIKITAVEKNHLEGEIIEIISSSPTRREAPCPYYRECGGCNWQHVHVAEQIVQKEKILIDLLKKFIPAAAFELLPTVKSENEFRYRNRIQLKQLGQKLGYFQRGRHEIVDINSCLITEEFLDSHIPGFKNNLRPSQEIKKFELRLNHLMQFESYAIGQEGEGLAFSQVNRFVNEKLVDSVLEMLKEIKPTFLTELYSGAGNFTFKALQEVPEMRVESVEFNSKLTQFATQELTRQNLQRRLSYFTSDCESFVARRPLSSECVLIDPPRAGCSEKVLNAIVTAAPENFIYVSCHPVHLARDLQIFLRSHPHYKLRYLQIFDMFPQTDHFETVVWLERAKHH